MRPEFILHDGRKVRITPSTVIGMSEITLYRTDDEGKPTFDLLDGGPWVRVVCNGDSFDVRGSLASVDEALDVWEATRS